MARMGDEPIASEVVRIGPDLSGFREKLKKDVEKATKGLTFKVKVEADGAGLRDSVRGEVRKQMALANQPVYKVKVVADATGLKRQVERDLKKLGGLSIGGRGGGRGDRDAEREARNAEREAKKAEDDHYRRVRTNLEKVEQAEERAMNTRYSRARDFQERVAGDELAAYREDVRRKKAADAEKEASIHGVTRAAEQAAKEQTRLAERAAKEQERIDRESTARRKKIFSDLSDNPQFIDYGGKGIRPMNILYGVVTAMTPALFAMGASAVQASTSIAALGSAGIGAAAGLSGVMIAFQGIGDLLSLRKQVLNEQTTGAANAAREAVRSADDLAQAKRSLADANRDEAAAEADLHKARREAVRDLEDLKQAVIDLDNQYKSDTLSVAEAREHAKATDRNFFASALERARAWQDVRDAETRLKDTTLQRRQKKQDLKESLAGGIERSDRVKQARERVRDARDRRLDAQAALRKSSSSTASGIDKVSSASAQLAAKLKELGPAAADMYHWFEKNEGLFKRLQRQINNDVLPGFTRFLEAITEAPKGGKSTLQLAAEYAGELGGIIGKYAGKFGEWTKTPLFRGSMARIQERNARAFDNLGQALLTLADPITRILDKASPGFESLSEILLKLSIRFDKWIEELDKSGGLEKWFTDARVELGKWWDILVNVGELFKNIFTAALPSGSSLVTSFRDFTQSLVDWSNSPNGQKSLKDFFEGVKNLPYAQIIDFFKNATTFFIAFRAFKLLKSLNPFMLALGTFAAANPQAAAQAFADIGNALAKAMEYIVTHPAAAATLLTLFAAAKVGKAVGLDIKLPVITSLRDALVNKFKVLDKFIGGGATTGTMNVTAGVVNIYGKTIGGGPGGVIGGDGKSKGKPGKTPRGGISGVIGGAGSGTIVTAAALAGFTIGMDELDRAKDLLSQKSKDEFHTWNDAITKKPFDWDNWYSTFVDNSAVVMIPLIAQKLLGGKVKNPTIPNFALPAMAEEKNAFGRLQKDLFYGGGFDNAAAQMSLQTYIAKRKATVSAYVRWVKSTEGPEAAQRAEREEVEKSKLALEDLYLQYGYTAAEAKKFADQAYATGDQTEKAAGKVGGLNNKLGTLSERLDAVTGKKQIVLDISGGEKVFATLEAAVAYQQAIRMGVEPNQSKLTQLKRQMEKNSNDPNLVDKYNKAPATPTPARTGPNRPGYRDPKKRPGYRDGKADGGLIGGYSPHDRADNIPAWLTAKEYVQPVSAVKYYGTDFMEAIRTRRFPKFADGGQAKWTFRTAMPNPLKPVEKYLDMYRGASSDQEYTGRVPRGLGAVAGLGARMMAAVVATHRLFPWASVNSGYRPGAITVSGNKSYHGMRRATDWPASMQLFNHFVATYGKFAKEIIYSPAGGRQIWNGRQHMYTGAVRRTHFNHVHLALADGGQVPARKYDRGGILPPGFTTVYNGTGRNETVRTDRQEKALAAATTRLDRRDLALLAQYVASATGNPAITMDGRRVAETTNRYNYLPAGV